MCRLFGQLSTTRQSGEPFLTASEASLLKQTDFDGANRQEDGWGIGHFNSAGKAVVTKSPKAAFKEAARFRKASRSKSSAIVAHVRAASNPRGIDRKRLINAENTQPFTDGRWLFAHNGTLEIPTEVADQLGPLRKRVKALNDSEVYFWQFIKFHERLGDPAAALQACIKETWKIWADCRGRYPLKKTPYTSLNAVVSDGKSLHAVCHSVRRGLAKCGVCNPDQPWQVMSFARRDDRLIVASENLDRGRWTRFLEPEILSATIEAGKISVRRLRVEVPKA
ncbi:MAG: class II glutamine amidotransferase [Elusimicrobiota bacterium]